jgi:hypothetical protein
MNGGGLAPNSLCRRSSDMLITPGWAADFRWDEKSRSPRDALSSQVIDALEAHEIRRPAMKKPSTTKIHRITKLQDRQ